MSCGKLDCPGGIFITKTGRDLEVRIEPCLGTPGAVRISTLTAAKLIAGLQERTVGLARGLDRPARFGAPRVTTVARPDGSRLFTVDSGEIPLTTINEAEAYELLSQLERALTKRDRGVH